MDASDRRFSMAPMAGVTDAAFRARLRRNGCRRLATEMVSAAALSRGNRRTFEYLQAPDGLDGLTVQLFGARPDELAEAARHAEEAGFVAVDLNMGCPVRKVVRSGSGAALLTDLALAGRCLRALRQATSGTLSVKIRSGWDEGSVNCLEVGRLAEECGVDFVTLHPRTRSQGYAGRADWSLVASLAASLSIPVVGNGDVSSAEEAVARLRETGCAGVMIGRAALGRPWLFQEAEARWAGRPVGAAPGGAEVAADLERQLEDLVRWKGSRVAPLEMRKFLSWAARGMPGATEFRRRIQAEPSVAGLSREIHCFFEGVAPFETQRPGGRGRGGGVRSAVLA